MPVVLFVCFFGRFYIMVYRMQQYNTIQFFNGTCSADVCLDRIRQAISFHNFILRGRLFRVHLFTSRLSFSIIRFYCNAHMSIVFFDLVLDFTTYYLRLISLTIIFVYNNFSHKLKFVLFCGTN